MVQKGLLFVVRGSSEKKVFANSSSSSERRCSLIRRVEPGSFVVVRVLASELALSAASPCVPRRHVPPGHEAAHGTQGSPLFFFFSFGFLCVCVCREASSAK